MNPAARTVLVRGVACRAAVVARGGFTLVEVIIAVAIALILMLGVNQVFRLTSNTVEAGMQLAEMARDDREIQRSFFDDFAHAAVNQPMFIVASQSLSKTPGGTQIYRSAIDKNSDVGTNFIDKNFRVDRLGFFASGAAFQRQTGDTGQFVSTTTGSEAYITYAPLKLANLFNSQGDYPGDAADTGGNNTQYAENWALGRNAIVMVDRQSIVDSSANAQPGTITDKNYFPRSGTNVQSNLFTFARTTTPGTPGRGGGSIGKFSDSKYDLASVTIDQYRSDVLTFQKNNPDWWTNMALDYSDPKHRVELFQYVQFPDRPLSATDPVKGRQLAQTTPFLVGHVSNFIVEFAGDYMTQKITTGGNGKTTIDVTSEQPDGKTDLMIDPVDGTQKIQWYGMWRNTHRPPNTAPNVNDLNNDVKPVRAVMPSAFLTKVTPPNAPVASMPFERIDSSYVGDATRYVCIWPGVSIDNEPVYDPPSMVRVTLKIEDPTHSLQDGRWYEYVLSR